MPGPTIQQKAVKEYGKSFERIVWDLAHEGISRNEAAQRLGYKEHSSFARMCNRNGWSQWFLPWRLTKGYQRSVAYAKRSMAIRWGKPLND